jgi:hypothetical protein
MVNHFKNIAMKVIIDILTEELIYEFDWQFYFKDEVEVTMFRSRIEKVMWKVQERAKEYYAQANLGN